MPCFVSVEPNPVHVQRVTQVQLFLILVEADPDHSGSGASPVGGGAQRSLKRRTLNLRTKSSQRWMLQTVGCGTPISRGNDPPPEFSGTKPSEFKSCRKKVKLWLSVHAHSISVARPQVLSKLTGPTWDACDGLEPEDVATDDGRT